MARFPLYPQSNDAVYYLQGLRHKTEKGVPPPHEHYYRLSAAKSSAASRRLAQGTKQKKEEHS